MGAAGSVEASNAAGAGEPSPAELEPPPSRELSRQSSALVQMTLRQASFSTLLRGNRSTTKEEFLKLGEEIFRRRVGEGGSMDERTFVEFMEELLSQYRLGGNEIKLAARSELSQGMVNILFVRDNCSTASWPEVHRMLEAVAEDLAKFNKYYDGKETASGT